MKILKSEIDHNRLYHGYYLDEYEHGLQYINSNACIECELEEHCDQIADELNLIEYCLCIDGIKDKEYKEKYPDAYFKKIDLNNQDK